MIIELNIGLDVAGSLNAQSQRDSRAEFAREALAFHAEILGARRATSTTEDTLVLSLDLERPRAGFYHAVYNLAINLSQDCIAVFEVEADNGALIGPNSVSWGEFNPEFFIRYSSEVAA
jgi:hypothetical protein